MYHCNLMSYWGAYCFSAILLDICYYIMSGFFYFEQLLILKKYAQMVRYILKMLSFHKLICRQFLTYCRIYSTPIYVEKISIKKHRNIHFLLHYLKICNCNKARLWLQIQTMQLKFRKVAPLDFRIVKNMINNRTKHTCCKISKQSKMV